MQKNANYSVLSAGLVLMASLGCSFFRTQPESIPESQTNAAASPAAKPDNAKTPPRAFVFDQASVVDADAEIEIERALGELLERSKLRVVVGTVQTTNGKDIGEYSIEKLDEWDVAGERGGFLFLAAIEDRQWYMRMSPGNDADLSNEELREIGGVVSADFKAKRYSDGVKKLVREMINVLAKKEGFGPVPLD